MGIIKILIVEDNPDHLHFIKEVLSSKMYQIEVIDNGLEAYKYLLKPKSKPDIILLDERIGNIDGLDILNKLSNKKEEYSFILTTIDSEPDIFVKALNQGVADILIKTPEYLYTLPYKIEKVFNAHKDRIEKSALENQYKKVIETVNDAVVIINHKGVIVEWNKASMQLFGYSKKEATGKTLSLIMPSKYKEAHSKAFNKALKEGVMSKAKYIYLEAINKQKNIFPIELTLSMWKSNDKPFFCAFIRDLSLQKKTEKELFEAQKMANIGSYTLDIASGLWQNSPLLDVIFGIDRNYIKTIEGWLNIVHPDEREELKYYLTNNVLEKRENFDKEYRIIKINDKEERWVYGLGELKENENGDIIEIFGTVQDITEQKKYQQELKKISRLYRSLSKINKAISREDTKERLFQKVCDIAVKHGQFKMAWIGFVDKEDSVIRPMAFSGDDNAEYLRNCKINLKNKKESKGQTARAILEKKSIVFNSYKNNSDYEPLWLGMAKEKGYKSSGGFPVIINKKAVAVLNLYTSESLFFDKKEITLCEEICLNLTFALEKFEEESKRKKTEQELYKTKEKIKESEKKFRELYEKSGDAILIIKNGIFVDCNEATVKMLNYKSKAAFLNTHPSKLSPELQPNGQKSFIESEKMMQKALKKGTCRFEWIHLKKDGEELPVEILLTAISNKPENKIIHCVWRDITERKKAEYRIKKHHQKLLEFQRITRLGTFTFEDSSGLFESSAICDSILGIDNKYNKNTQGWKNLVYPDDYQEVQKIVGDDTVKSFFKELRIIRPRDKKEIWILVSVEKQFDTSGKKVKTSGTVRDITQRKRNEIVRQVIYNITKKAQTIPVLDILFDFIRKELSQVMDTTNFFIALYDEETDMISTPYMVDEQDDRSDFPKGETLTGHLIESRKSILAENKELNEIIIRKQIKVLGPLSKCWLGVPLLIENKVVGAIVIQSYKDQKAYTIEDLKLLELVASNLSLVIKTARDNEQIKLLSHALIQSAEAVIITNLDGEIQYTNPAFTTLSGYSEKEVLGQNPRLLKSGNQEISYYEKLWNTILSGQIWDGEFVNKRKNGTKFLVKANISPIINEAGDITHFIGIEEDITEKRKLERDFIHAFIDAQEQEKINFGEDLHDGISQILAAESMFIDVLIKQNEDRLEDKAKHLLRVKELNLSAINEARSIAHGLMSKQLKERGLLKAVEHICKDYNTTKNITFNYFYRELKEEEISKEIKINIFRIIQEISTNTIRHSGANKAAIMLKKTKKNTLILNYSDDGVGIDFEKMKREYKGAGLKNIERRVTLLNGTCKLNSTLNKGINYIIEVPLFSI
jgi:PAS domain S-box-containing protein